MSDHALLGSWRLVTWESIAEDDGEVSRPMGETPEGLLSYTAEGRMLVLIGRSDRPRSSDDDFFGGSTAERAAAAESFVAYGGRFEVAGDDVLHHVELSLFPNWVGSTQRRTMVFGADGDTLELTSPPFVLGSVLRTQRLRWSRIRG